MVRRRLNQEPLRASFLWGRAEYKRVPEPAHHYPNYPTEEPSRSLKTLRFRSPATQVGRGNCDRFERFYLQLPKNLSYTLWMSVWSR